MVDMNRRSFLVGGAVGAVTIAISVIRVATASPAPVADATGTSAPDVDMAPMAGMAGMNTTMVDPKTHSFDFQGHSVRVTESSDAAVLVIDGRHLIHLERPEVGQYHTHLLPFNTYTDSSLLVRDVLEASASHLFVI